MRRSNPYYREKNFEYMSNSLHFYFTYDSFKTMRRKFVAVIYIYVLRDIICNVYDHIHLLPFI